MKNNPENFLSKQTGEIFKLIDQFEFIRNFTLVGGSGLAFYLNHRLSEDLDFFTWEATLEKHSLDKFLNAIKNSYKIKVINQSQVEFDVLINDIKVTFFANDWRKIKTDRYKKYENIFIGNLDLLTAMKVNTLSMRAKFRDYYDLYVLCKEKFDINQIFEISKNRLPGITKKIFAMQISYIDDIDDESVSHLNLKYNISLPDIHKYFEQQISEYLI